MNMNVPETSNKTTGKLNRRRKVDHPVWALARLAVIMAPLSVVLYVNSSKFDITEIKALIEFGILAGGFEGIRMLKDR